jgi:hypothetical protein
MRRLLAFVILLTLLVVGGTLVSAEGQRRRHRSKFGRKARTAAIIGGGAGVGALAAGKKGAAIGAGGAGLYAFNRRAARRHFHGSTRTAGTVVSGTALGSGVGAAAGVNEQRRLVRQLARVVRTSIHGDIVDTEQGTRKLKKSERSI